MGQYNTVIFKLLFPADGMSYRSILETVRIPVPMQSYPQVDAAIEGDLPPWPEQKLPLFGGTGERYLNSGGRGILIEGDGVYRLKGVDPFGTITERAAASRNTMINDVRVHATHLPPEREHLQKTMTNEGRGRVPRTDHKPFNFVTYLEIANANDAFTLFGERFEQHGFQLPCRYAGSVMYPDIMWSGDPVYSLVFELPDAESDLRETEIHKLLARHLRYATVEQLQDLLPPVQQLYEHLLEWYGFNTAIMLDGNRVPTPASLLGQNHVIGSVGEGLGLQRVDHTPTIHDPEFDKGDQFRFLAEYGAVLYTFPSLITQAIEMSEEGTLPEGRTNWFDAAYQHQGDFSSRTFPRTANILQRGAACYIHGLKQGKADPFDERLLTDVVEQATQIEYDREEPLRWVDTVVPTNFIRRAR